MTGTRNLLLVVIAILILPERAHGTAQCPRSEDGKYPLLTSCRHYLECVHTGTTNAQVYTRECPKSNRFFNPYFRRCFWLPSRNCNQRGTATTSPPPTLPPEVDGLWGSWSAWSGCSVTCGGGYQSRTRECNSPQPANGGSYCSDSHFEVGSCNSTICPQPTVNGAWGAWTSWSGCSRTCGSGYRSRTRQCNSPPPSIGGNYCSGSPSDTRPCITAICTVNGAWGAWTSWSGCSRTCGGGYRSRTRQCNSPPPSMGGSYCSGSPSDTQSCNMAICPVNGVWGAWASWSGCSRTCGGGYRSRTRQCNSPPPSNGGSYCSGSPSDTQPCNTAICTVNGNWASWSGWAGCLTGCGGRGYQHRTRQCNSPLPTIGGSYCSGDPYQRRTCADSSCSWSVWGSCSRTCGFGQRTRSRCSCSGSDRDTESCYLSCDTCIPGPPGSAPICPEPKAISQETP